MKNLNGLLMLVGCGDNSSKTDKSTATQETTKTTEAEKQGIVQVPVTIINGTDVDFSELYTSGSNVEDWGDNIIDNGAEFIPGNTMKATFNVDVNNLKWDFQAVDGNGDSLEFKGLDLSNCDASGVTIKLSYDRNTQTGTITAE